MGIPSSAHAAATEVLRQLKSRVQKRRLGAFDLSASSEALLLCVGCRETQVVYARTRRRPRCPCSSLRAFFFPFFWSEAFCRCRSDGVEALFFFLVLPCALGSQSLTHVPICLALGVASHLFIPTAGAYAKYTKLALCSCVRLCSYAVVASA